MDHYIQEDIRGDIVELNMFMKVDMIYLKASEVPLNFTFLVRINESPPLAVAALLSDAY